MAIRLRTLPLALSSILAGQAIAAQEHRLDLLIFLLACLTTIFLQILSNLANDYGDSIHGADNLERTGPLRAVQKGAISSLQMKSAISLIAALSFISGLILLFVAFKENWQVLITFLGLGVLAIAAAIFYTNGKRPYGYVGLGDVSVLIFFGPVGVVGSYYLQAQSLNASALGISLGIGALAVGVLNVNNLRDIKSDQLAGKLSIPVRLGFNRAKYYHIALLIIGVGSFLVSTIASWKSNYSQIGLVGTFFIGFGLSKIVKHGKAVSAADPDTDLDPQLKELAIGTLLLSVGLFLLNAL